MIPSDIGPPLDEAVNDLMVDGWTVKRVIDHGVNDDLLIVLEAGTLEVLLFYDRGDPGIHIKPQGWSSGYRPSTWCRALGLDCLRSPYGAMREPELLRYILPYVRTAVSEGALSQEEFRRRLDT